jgi:hypothetical protein
MAIALPVVSSVTLLLLFFYFGIISQLLLAVTCTMGTLAIIFCLYPLASMLFPSLTKRELRVCCCKIAAIFYILGVVAIICILLWLFTGHALLSNFIAVSWCILSMSIYRVPNLKIATIVLIGLFFYDIFWVFFSHHFFGKNVISGDKTGSESNEYDRSSTSCQWQSCQGIAITDGSHRRSSSPWVR